MTNKEIIEDINYRVRKSDIIKKLEEEVSDGIYDDDPLIDLVLYYKRDIDQLEEENERLYKTIKEKDGKLTDKEESMLIECIKNLKSLTDDEYNKIFNGGIPLGGFKKSNNDESEQ